MRYIVRRVVLLLTETSIVCNDKLADDADILAHKSPITLSQRWVLLWHLSISSPVYSAKFILKQSSFLQKNFRASNWSITFLPRMGKSVNVRT